MMFCNNGLRLLEASVVQSTNNHSFVGAGSLMTMQRYSDQQVPLNSKIHNSLRHLNPPSVANTICRLFLNCPN